MPKGREEALRFIATNIGASRKRNLSPEERRRLVITGQYGVGLLGFWSIGRRMEIRSRVGGSGLHVLERLTGCRNPRTSRGTSPAAPATMSRGRSVRLRRGQDCSDELRRAHEAIAPSLRGQRMELDEACARIRGWIAKQLSK